MDVQPDEGAAVRKDRGTRVRRDKGHVGPRGKRTFVLSDEAYERLSVHALRERVDRSELLERLINGSCKRYVVQDRGGRSPLERSVDPAIGVKDSVETLSVAETLIPEIPPAPGAGEGGAARTGRVRQPVPRSPADSGKAG